MHGVWTLFLAAGIVVYVLVAGLIIFAAIAFRRRDATTVQAASFFKNDPLEIAWTVIPILVVGGLFAVTYGAERHTENVVKRAGEVVQVTGFDWSWRFVYPRRHVAIEGAPGTPPELVLPLDRTTEIRLTSSDVVHSFWVPAFLFKRMAIPGAVNVFDFTPTRAGVYPGRCAEFCGTYHGPMTFTVRVLPSDAYARWLRAHGPA